MPDSIFIVTIGTVIMHLISHALAIIELITQAIL